MICVTSIVYQAPGIWYYYVLISWPCFSSFSILIFLAHLQNSSCFLQSVHRPRGRERKILKTSWTRQKNKIPQLVRHTYNIPGTLVYVNKILRMIMIQSGECFGKIISWSKVWILVTSIIIGRRCTLQLYIYNIHIHTHTHTRSCGTSEFWVVARSKNSEKEKWNKFLILRHERSGERSQGWGAGGGIKYDTDDEGWG